MSAYSIPLPGVDFPGYFVTATMTDEVKAMPIPQLQGEGLSFLWVTGVELGGERKHGGEIDLCERFMSSIPEIRDAHL